MTTKVKGIAEIVLNVHDLEKSLHFYHTLLGLEIMGQPGPVFLRAGNPVVTVPQMIVLMPLSPTSARFLRPLPLHHLALELDPADFDAQEAALQENGYTVRYGQHPLIPSRTMYVDDPDGNEVEFICGQE